MLEWTALIAWVITARGGCVLLSIWLMRSGMRQQRDAGGRIRRAWTALGERLDPEDVRALQGELCEWSHAEVERFGATTDKFAGDAVVRVFGIPHAHEDGPERAVRGALAVRESFVSFRDRVQG